VSRIIAQIVDTRRAKTSAATTVYDPACGSGSLLLKLGDETGTSITLYGQEKDAATSGLARMNMILHDNPTQKGCACVDRKVGAPHGRKCGALLCAADENEMGKLQSQQSLHSAQH
jgi:hypothetical protein